MDQISIFITLGGLLIFTLLLASLVRQYQERMAVKRMQIRRLLRGVDQIVDLLQRVSDCPIPAEIERILRKDVLERYLKVQQIDRDFMGIEAMINQAQDAAGQVQEKQGFNIQDQSHLSRVTRALGEMIGYLQCGMLLQPVSQEQIQAFTELLGTCRSECVYRHHMAKAEEMRQAHRIHAALEHYNRIKLLLKEYGPDNSQVQTWCKEVEGLMLVLENAGDSSAPAA